VSAQLSEELGESLHGAPQGAPGGLPTHTCPLLPPWLTSALASPTRFRRALGECQTDGAAHAAVSSCLALALVTLTLTHVQVPLVRHRLRPVLVLVL
jgi:hypothetical protein